VAESAFWEGQFSCSRNGDGAVFVVGIVPKSPIDQVSGNATIRPPRIILNFGAANFGCLYQCFTDCNSRRIRNWLLGGRGGWFVHAVFASLQEREQPIRHPHGTDTWLGLHLREPTLNSDIRRATGRRGS
jgi:hypothetical protein